MKITELKEFYNFEEQIEAIRNRCLISLDFYVHLLKEKDFSQNFSEKQIIEGYVEEWQKILASEKLLEKATTLDAMVEIKQILSSCCHDVSSNSLIKLQTPLCMFGQELEFDESMQCLSAEELREILFDAVGLEFTPLSSVYQAMDSYNNARREKGQEVSVSGYSKVYEVQKNLEKLTHLSLVSARQDYYFFNNEVDALFYDYFGNIGFPRMIYTPKEIIGYPDTYLPERIDRKKSKV